MNPITRVVFNREEKDMVEADFASLFDEPDSVRGEWDNAVRAGRTVEIVGLSAASRDVELVLAPSFDRFEDLIGGIALVRKNDIFSDAFSRYGITTRERDVVLMLLQGHNRKEIANSKFI